MKTAFALTLMAITLATSAAFAEKIFKDENSGPVAIVPRTSTVAPACVPDIATAATLLAQSTVEIEQMKTQNIDHATKITCEQLGDGQFSYAFTFGRMGMRIPAFATLVVTADYRPTYADGAPIFTKSLVFAQ